MNVITKAYMNQDRPFRFYLVIWVTFAIGFLWGFPSLMAWFLGPQLYAGIVPYAIWAMAFFMVFISIIVPIAEDIKARADIDFYMPVFITRMMVLSTSKTHRLKIFKVAISTERYGYLTTEIDKVVALVDLWGFSLSDACVFVADRTPSEFLKEFLERVSHSMQAGENFTDFLINEQDIIMDDYVIEYDASLKEMDIVKEVFVAMCTSVVFMAVFLTVLPMLTRSDPIPLLVIVLFLFLLIEIVVAFYVRTRLPRDDIWYSQKDKEAMERIPTKVERIVVVELIIAVVACIYLAYYMLPLNISTPTTLAVVVTPFLIPGIFIRLEEAKVVKREMFYASFIRAVGRASSYAGGQMESALEKLVLHDFGALTEPVVNLHRRLTMRMGKELPWSHFTAETGSNLIARFCDMFVQSVLIGAEAKDVSLLISNNFSRLLQLRKKRYGEASTFSGVFYGLSFSISLTFFITLRIARMMKNMLNRVTVSAGDDLNQGFIQNVLNANIDLVAIQFIMVSMIFIHSFFSSLTLSFARGGHKASAYIHFVGMMWLAAIVYEGVERTLGGIIG